MTIFVFICMCMCERFVYKLQVRVPSANTCTILRILPRPLLLELAGGGGAFRYASKTARLPGGSYVFVDTESAGSRMNHLNMILLVWRVVGHVTASGADAGQCIFN